MVMTEMRARINSVARDKKSFSDIPAIESYCLIFASALGYKLGRIGVWVPVWLLNCLHRLYSAGSWPGRSLEPRPQKGDYKGIIEPRCSRCSKKREFYFEHVVCYECLELSEYIESIVLWMGNCVNIHI
jgi:hypothetical protein